MKTTKRIIIRIIVAVAVAIILSKLKLLNIIEVSAKSTTDQFTYNNVLIDSSTKTFNFSNNFAKGFNYGSLKTNVSITTNIVTSGTPTVLRQVTVLNGGLNEVCKIGSLQSGNLFTLPTSGTFNGYNLSSQTYSIECNLKPNSIITSMTLYFSGSLNQSYLSFGPYATFKEEDISCLDFSSKSSLVQGGTDVNNDNFFNSDTRITTKNWINLPPGNYTISSNSTNPLQVYFMTDNYNDFPQDLLYKWNNLPLSFTITKQLKVKYNIRNSSNTQIALSDISSFSLNGCVDKQDLTSFNQQEQTKQQEETNKQIKETNDLIKNDNVDDSTSQGSSFFNDFSSDTPGGLSGVITAPLSFIQSLTSKSCTPLHLEIGLVDKEFDLPCATTLMQQNFPSVLEFYQTITFGVISYLILIKIFGIVKDAKNPDSDKIEVLDL